MGEHSDLNIYIDGYGLVARAHKLILSLWSVPFMKMFMNGMSESNSSDIYLRDVSVEAFLSMLQFMCSGELETEDRDDMGDQLLPLRLLSDQFGVTFLQQECCSSLLECLSECEGVNSKQQYFIELGISSLSLDPVVVCWHQPAT